MRTIRESRLGFTLIELLVVIAIIAILAAILFPVFSRARQRANMLSCLSNLKQLSLAFKMYADDNGGRMPSSGDSTAGGLRPAANAPNFCGSFGAYQKADVTQGSIFPYVKAEKMFLCPSDRNREASNIIGTPEEKKKYPLSYSMNNSLSLMKPEALAIRVNGVVTDLQPTRMLLLIPSTRRAMAGTIPRTRTRASTTASLCPTRAMRRTCRTGCITTAPPSSIWMATRSGSATRSWCRSVTRATGRPSSRKL
jgi:prepilin-type N-terminal cleavage/methylation domain-containing protein